MSSSSIYWSLLFLIVYCPFFLLFTSQSTQAINLINSRNSKSSSYSHGGKKLATKSSNETSSQSKPKFFLPTSLSINKEIKVYIFDQEVKRFTFSIESKLEAPLTLTVTPCSDPIKWTFEFIEDTDSKELISLKKRRRHGKHGHRNHNRLRHRRHRNDGKQLQSSTDGSQSESSTSRLLFKYNGINRKSFTDIRRQYSGQYVIQLSSSKRATSATLILSHFNPYPLLPVNDNLSTLSLTESSVTLTWQQSPSEPDYLVDYYAIINQDHNVISYCEYLQQTESLLKYPSSSLSLRSSNISMVKVPITLTTKSPVEFNDDFGNNLIRLGENNIDNEVINPSMSPFVRWYERTMAKTWESELSRKNWTSRNIFRIEPVGKGSTHYQHTFRSLEPSTRYYIDVIAAIKHTGRTSLYKGFNVTTKEKPKIMSSSLPLSSSSIAVSSNARKSNSLLTKLIKLRDKRLVSVSLSRRNNYTEIMTYNYNESDFNVGESLWLFVQVCSASLTPVDVIIHGANPPDNSVLIKEIGITGSRVINIPMGFKWYNQSIYSKSLTDEKQSMVISLNANSLQHYRHHRPPLEVNLMMTKKRLHIPYPQLPRDRIIRVLDLLSTCNSVSLAWIASPDEKARYCIYAASIQPNVPESLIHNELKSLAGFTVNSTSPSFCESLQSTAINETDKIKGRKQLKSNTKKKSILDKSKHFKRLKCRRFAPGTNSRLHQVIIQDVDNLNPSTEYVFLVELIKSNKGLTAYYNPLTTSTKSKETC
ncbi:protein NDNF-like [Panonychus citri]|uniref:protein NDNF-like n=1 Tax=Panonychus citri TaxID=50023 RepID=UPI002307162B|nr:protein NDNF-like [Panonychus citri]